ncbi:hypothetical protein ARTHRO9AX_80002 [Arthrobacter sp. 9AX]|nr:hypothetical protein ARTHRO9AX_80002 [Arthrobacter sp. 9AX]
MMWATLKSLSGACRLETTGGIAAHDIPQHSYVPRRTLWPDSHRCWCLAFAGWLLGRSARGPRHSTAFFRGLGVTLSHANSDADTCRRLQTRRRVRASPKRSRSSAARGCKDGDERRGGRVFEVLV